MEILSIIPARGGSTRVPNKNIRLLGGKPLLYYTIKASTSSKVSRTIVSTDDHIIASIARRYGAEVPFLRPKKFSTFKASSISVIIHCLNFLKNENYMPDYIVFLPPTTPYRTACDINKAIKKIKKSNATSLIGITKVDKHPFFMFKKQKNDKLLEFDKTKNKKLRSQELPKLYNLVDGLVITKTKYFESASMNQSVFDWKNLLGLEMETLHSLDIDTEFDFQVVKNLYPIFRNN